MGAQWAVLGLVSAEGLSRGREKTRSLLRLRPQARPLFAQIFGADPQTMARAATVVEELGFDGLDINAGCTKPSVLRIGAGAALMRNLKKAEAVVKGVRKAVQIPVTLKMRLGWQRDVNFIQLGKIAEDHGLNAVILHPRTVEDGFRSRARWERCSELRCRLSIPVIVSGDVVDRPSFEEALRESQCDSVLIGRAALSRPFIFRTVLGGCLPDFKERGSIIRRYLALNSLYEEGEALIPARRHLPFLLKGFPCAAEIRGKIQKARTWSVLISMVEDYLSLVEVSA